MIDLSELDKILQQNEQDRKIILSRLAQLKAEQSRLEHDYAKTKTDVQPFLAKIDGAINEVTDQCRDAVKAWGFDDTNGLNPVTVARASQKLADVTQFTTFETLVRENDGAQLIALCACDVFERKQPVFVALDSMKYHHLKLLCQALEIAEEQIGHCTELFDKRREVERKSFIMPVNFERKGPAPTEHDIKRATNPHLVNM
ncbi:hypothetical protein [Vibrio sp.]|uniref:hypothetical protein n=1 Tax=Vibrio sp. TaxID=678 RepID=UPI003AA886E9